VGLLLRFSTAHKPNNRPGDRVKHIGQQEKKPENNVSNRPTGLLDSELCYHH
jgi:hypothetical protein